jgi:hypothetical protein
MFFIIITNTLYQAGIADNKTLIIFDQFWQLMVDIPFIIIGICCLWRAPFLLYRVITELSEAKERRWLVFKYLKALLKDIPCSVLLAVMLVTVWRIPRLYQKYQKVNP